MQKSFWGIIILQFFIVIFLSELKAQSLPVGTPVFEDALRREQLLGNIDSSISFLARPLFPSTFIKQDSHLDPINKQGTDRFIKLDGNYTFGKGKGIIKLLPVTWLWQYNSHHPEGLNDGAMIPAKGNQTMISAGIYAQYGILSIQLKPEFVYAENLIYPGFPHTRVEDYVYADQLWYAMYHAYYNKIDQPERFGEVSYRKIFWGQSSIRLTKGALSFGLSTENLWWGPGLRNSLIMTNSAPGFSHFTLNTIKPIKTPIGSFEGQLIAGRLNQSGYAPPEPTRNYNGGPPLYESKPKDWRYINAMILSYQPKWVPGLFLGATRSFQVYEQNMGTRIGSINLGDIFPVFTAIAKNQKNGDKIDARHRDMHTSVFMRWVWLKAHGEIYAEYGRQNYFVNTQDLEVEPAFSAAYVVGFRKLTPFLSRKDEYIQVNLELTQLEMNSATRNRNGQSWYVSDQVTAGYTHMGQLLGAGIGPGSNLQTLNISWVKGIKQVGIQFERFVHNNDFRNKYIHDIRNHWVDLSATLHGEWNYKNLIVTAKAGFVKSFDYQWLFYPPPATEYFWTKGEDDFNFHGQIGLMYRF